MTAAAPAPEPPRQDPPPAPPPGPRQGLPRGWRAPIVWLLVLALPGLTFVAVASVLTLGLLEARTLTRTVLRERAGVLLERVIADLDRRLHPVSSQLAIAAQTLVSGAIDSESDDALYHFVAGLLTATPEVAGIALARPDRQLNLFRRAGDRTERDRQRSPDQVRRLLDQAPQLDQARWIEPVWTPYFRRATLVRMQPVRAPAGFVGLLFAPVTVDALSRGLAAAALAHDQTPFVLLSDDRVLLHPLIGDQIAGVAGEQRLPSAAELGDPVLARLRGADATPLAPDETPPGTTGSRVVIDGVTHIGLFRSVDDYGNPPWVVGSHFSEAEIGAAELAALARLAPVGGAVLVVAVLISLAVGRTVGLPIRRLAGAAQAIEAGDLDGPRLPGSPIRELDQAEHAFNAMAAGLRDRERIRDLFGKYVPLAVARDVLADPAALRLGGENREITVLFSDIEGFTTLAETLSPDRVLTVLNAYFEGVGRILVDHGGIVVDFVGDAVLAIFGAPVPHADHARRALAAARAIEAFGETFVREQRAQGLAFGRTRLGLHTGVAIVGNIGSRDRLKYGAAGDVVNTGSRLEGANKLLGSSILASAETVRHAGDADTRPVGAVVLKGRHGAIDAHEVLPVGSATADWHAAYLAAFERLERQPDAAAALLEDLAARRPGDPIVRTLLARLADGSAGALIMLAGK